MGSPPGWTARADQAPWSNAVYGGSSTVYTTTWCCTFGGAQPGQTVSGFQVSDSSATAQSSVSWFAFAYGGTYTGSDHFYYDTNPGFEGVATAVPEPDAYVMLLAGLGLAGWMTRRRGSSKG
jgi:hypothetical protein